MVLRFVTAGANPHRTDESRNEEHPRARELRLLQKPAPEATTLPRDSVADKPPCHA